jgi:hypothetical protein
VSLSAAKEGASVAVRPARAQREAGPFPPSVFLLDRVGEGGERRETEMGWATPPTGTCTGRKPALELAQQALVGRVGTKTPHPVRLGCSLIQAPIAAKSEMEERAPKRVRVWGSEYPCSHERAEQPVPAPAWCPSARRCWCEEQRAPGGCKCRGAAICVPQLTWSAAMSGLGALSCPQLEGLGDGGTTPLEAGEACEGGATMRTQGTVRRPGNERVLRVHKHPTNNDIPEGRPPKNAERYTHAGWGLRLAGVG